LGGQPFQVLAILLERPGDIFTRGELQQRLWPDTFVDVDHNLNTAINKIREVLGDSAENPRFIETLSRRGYRFIAPVETDGPNRLKSTQPRKLLPILLGVRGLGGSGIGNCGLQKMARTCSPDSRHSKKADVRSRIAVGRDLVSGWRLNRL
jgi:Transcriptional regulatory protein, C terminal